MGVNTKDAKIEFCFSFLDNLRFLCFFAVLDSVARPEI